jgi:hypothetical protein
LSVLWGFAALSVGDAMRLSRVFSCASAVSVFDNAPRQRRNQQTTDNEAKPQ